MWAPLILKLREYEVGRLHAFQNFIILLKIRPSSIQSKEYYPVTGDRGDNSIDIGGWRHWMVTLRFRGDETPCWTNLETIYFYQEFGKCNIYQTRDSPAAARRSFDNLSLFIRRNSSLVWYQSPIWPLNYRRLFTHRASIFWLSALQLWGYSWAFCGLLVSRGEASWGYTRGGKTPDRLFSGDNKLH